MDAAGSGVSCIGPKTCCFGNGLSKLPMLSLKFKDASSRETLIGIWKGLSFPSWSLPVVLLVVAILAFGLFIPWLGFYWDDWPSIWFLHLLGPLGFRDVFASDRPFLGQLFILSTGILGEKI